MLKRSLNLAFGLWVLVVLSACNATKNTSVKSSGISTDSNVLPAAVIANSQLGPQDEAPVVLSSTGEYQLANNNADSLPVVQYEGISD